MSLDRDELAARNMAALLGRDGHVGDAEAQRLAADVAVGCADALIARLAPAPWVGEPGKRMFADAAPRPEWVRLSGDFRLPLERKVVRWEGHQPVVMHSSGLSELAPLVGGEWEPCAAPAPSPAAAPDHPTAASFAARRGQGAVGDQHPAAYVPQVGDVVRTTEQPTTDKWDGTLVVLKDGFVMHGATPHIDAARTDETDGYGGHYLASKCVYLRPATAAERAAAGLPPITPDHPQGGQGAEAEGRVGDQRVAAGLDAPAKPAFDETSEREAAVDIAKDRGLDVAEEVGFVAGWLARARIAASPAPAVVPESAREGLAGVMRAAWYDEEAPWDEARPRVKADWLRAADAAIAFLKANGGVA